MRAPHGQWLGAIAYILARFSACLRSDDSNENLARTVILTIVITQTFSCRGAGLHLSLAHRHRMDANCLPRVFTRHLYLLFSPMITPSFLTHICEPLMCSRYTAFFLYCIATYVFVCFRVCAWGEISEIDWLQLGTKWSILVHHNCTLVLQRCHFCPA